MLGDELRCQRLCPPSRSGLQSIRKRYEERFLENEVLIAKIEKRILLGKRVIDYELVFGSSFGELSLVVIYEVNAENKICRVDFIYAD